VTVEVGVLDLGQPVLQQRPILDQAILEVDADLVREVLEAGQVTYGTTGVPAQPATDPRCLEELRATYGSSTTDQGTGQYVVRASALGARDSTTYNSASSCLPSCGSRDLLGYVPEELLGSSGGSAFLGCSFSPSPGTTTVPLEEAYSFFLRVLTRTPRFLKRGNEFSLPSLFRFDEVIVSPHVLYVGNPLPVRLRPRVKVGCFVKDVKELFG
jgi:hypothetical protein